MAASHSAVRKALLRWFKRNARSLPWRQTPSPYAIWVSEVMLQQTQVATVIPYYQRFIQAFPNPERLAEASLERVLSLWSGLGYYRRARHLHAAARVLEAEFAGEFPRDYRSARSLPGVGDYTARAVLSIAYNQPYSVVDGNVARVVARLGAWRGNLGQRRFRRRVEAELDQLLSPTRPGDFNQALMELGQTVCLPRAPQCSICPLQRWCAAFEEGDPESYPEPRPRRPAELHYLAAALVTCDHKLGLVQGLDAGVLLDLWNPPAAFGDSESDAALELAKKLGELLHTKVRLGKVMARASHGITYRSIRIQVYEVALSSCRRSNSIRWFSQRELASAPISQLTRKICATAAPARPHTVLRYIEMPTRGVRAGAARHDLSQAESYVVHRRLPRL